MAYSDYEILTPQQAAEWAKCDRGRIDGACTSGTLRAVDNRPESSKRQWRILFADLIDWHRRGRPAA
ncbi:MAG: hypothetical protein QM628_17320 [Propionicimonas sp.]